MSVTTFSASIVSNLHVSSIKYHCITSEKIIRFSQIRAKICTFYHVLKDNANKNNSLNFLTFSNLLR